MTKLRITCQYFENYSDNPSTPYWKPKGGAEFSVEIGFETLMYGQDEMMEVAREMVAERCDGHNRYEVLHIEPIFFEVEELDANELAKRVDDKIKAARLKAEQEQAEVDGLADDSVIEAIYNMPNE